MYPVHGGLSNFSNEFSLLWNDSSQRLVRVLYFENADSLDGIESANKPENCDCCNIKIASEMLFVGHAVSQTTI